MKLGFAAQLDSGLHDLLAAVEIGRVAGGLEQCPKRTEDDALDLGARRVTALDGAVFVEAAPVPHRNGPATAGRDVQRRGLFRYLIKLNRHLVVGKE
jgi:hypothetical protein